MYGRERGKRNSAVVGLRCISISACLGVHKRNKETILDDGDDFGRWRRFFRLTKLPYACKNIIQNVWLSQKNVSIDRNRLRRPKSSPACPGVSVIGMSTFSYIVGDNLVVGKPRFFFEFLHIANKFVQVLVVIDQLIDSHYAVSAACCCSIFLALKAYWIVNCFELRGFLKQH